MIKKFIKHLEGSASGLVGVLALQLSKGTKENNDKPQSWPKHKLIVNTLITN